MKYVIVCIFDNFQHLVSIAQLNTKKILIYVIALDKIYILYRYLFGIRMCSILAKCWKSSEMTKNSIFLLILLILSPNKSPFNQYYPKSVANPGILIILLPKNDKIVVLAEILFLTIFPV